MHGVFQLSEAIHNTAFQYLPRYSTSEAKKETYQTDDMVRRFQVRVLSTARAMIISLGGYINVLKPSGNFTCHQV
jgi:ferredoxin-NADP reductase